ncbi:unnamed protein product [Rhizopus stolonifer]
MKMVQQLKENQRTLEDYWNVFFVPLFHVCIIAAYLLQAGQREMDIPCPSTTVKLMGDSICFSGLVRVFSIFGQSCFCYPIIKPMASWLFQRDRYPRGSFFFFFFFCYFCAYLPYPIPFNWGHKNNRFFIFYTILYLHLKGHP